IRDLRKPLPCEAAEYTDYQSLRLIVKPGLTCLWQVRTDRNAVSFAEWVEDDMEYILNASLWGDVKLMLKTPFVMLRGEGC
ncbi:MAG: sugar transferase, partial [Oscillospiraceae bacterium]|nr:sugar transferase [Oscillospiraceae bacterium]